MSDIEEVIYDVTLEEGLSSKAKNLIEDNLSVLSSEFLTDVLAENANIHNDYLLLIDYLPSIWNNNENSSKNLLAYISGIAHKLFYFAREYPLGKKPSIQIKTNLENIHSSFHGFKSECMMEEFVPVDINTDSINAFDELINSIKEYPKLPVQLNEIFYIISNLFFQFALNRKQRLANIDELCLFLSRCIILWKLETLTDQELKSCLEEASKKYRYKINLSEFQKILALELQNYQFLQLGINHYLVNIITEVFYKIHD